MKIISVTYLWIFSAGIGLSQNKKIEDYSDAEFYNLIEINPVSIVENHGEEIMSYLLLQPAKKDAQVATDNNLVTNKKDFPIIKALLNSGDKSVDLIESTKYLRLPAHPKYTETMAYILYELIGQHKAIELANSKLNKSTGYEYVNWSSINDFLQNADLRSGRFITQTKFKDSNQFTNPSLNQILIKRKNIEEFLTKSEVLASSDALDYYYKLDKIIIGINKFKSLNQRLPNDLNSLVDIKILEKKDLIFTGDQNNIYIPEYKNIKEIELKTRPALLILTADKRGIIKAYLDGEIQFSLTPNK